ncbi:MULTISPECIES: TerB family tellurite resistance protein [unclassified Thioalkalivibrio]|uniref:tellurite resistance TerB family protein n=1 Tax=unclassified Thioalkalivibrio TaxID=2621013 RepID=UPI00036C543F|nr:MULTISPECIES: TerB family tellurite resistance protein [unclassified Thioalkalivibrio]
MIDELRRHWQRLMRTDLSDTESGDDEHRLQRAAAALIMEVCRADFELHEAELDSVRASLIELFELDADTADGLLEIAREKSDELVSVHPLVREVNAAFDADQKADIMRALWRAAWANQDLHKRQEAVIRHLADLLYVPHSTFIRTKHEVLGDAADPN